ncbi:MAG: YdgA family protein [Desulfurivibrionaceae bacterium]|nr:YdgA family protein [Desulfurivibrionaceae bacterium]
MKKVLILITVLIFLFLGAYAACSFLAQRQYALAVTEMEKNFPGQIDSSYEQGLFSSQLVIRLKMATGEAHPAMPETITSRISQTIHHGPFIFRAPPPGGSRFRPVQFTAHGTLEIEPFIANEPPLIAQIRQLAATDINVHAPLMGRTRVSFRGTPRQESWGVGSESFSLAWQGFTATLFLEDRNLRTYDLDLELPGVAIQGQGARALVLDEMRFQATMEEGSNHLSLGTMLISLQKLEVIPGNRAEEKIIMAGLQGRLTSSAENGLLRIEEEITLDHLLLAGQQYGPANLQISLANLDAQTVAQLSKEFQALQMQEGNEAMARDILSSHVPALLAKSPEIRLNDFSLATPAGACEASARLAFDGEGEMSSNPLLLLGRLSAEAALTADEGFLAVQTKKIIKQRLCGQHPAPDCDQEAARAGSKQLQDLTEQGILVLKGGKYTLKASFKNGQALLNGQPIPLPF